MENQNTYAMDQITLARQKQKPKGFIECITRKPVSGRSKGCGLLLGSAISITCHCSLLKVSAISITCHCDLLKFLPSLLHVIPPFLLSECCVVADVVLPSGAAGAPGWGRSGVS